jgi:PIN domain nuclease of toxin-antitoxin system
MDSAVEMYLSAVSVWEIEIKRALGKLDAPENIVVVARDAACRPRGLWRHITTIRSTDC